MGKMPEAQNFLIPPRMYNELLLFIIFWNMNNKCKTYISNNFNIKNVKFEQLSARRQPQEANHRDDHV